MSGWTADDLARLGRQRAGNYSGNPKSSTCKKPLQVARACRGSFQKNGMRSGLERDYAARLETQKRAGEIADYRYECLNLRLADRTFYMPDFLVLLPDGTFEVHEVKGFWTEDARVKFKVAASLFPFRFVAITRKGREWQFERLDYGEE